MWDNRLEYQDFIKSLSVTQEFGECVAEEDKEQDIKHLCGKHIKQKIRRKQKV